MTKKPITLAPMPPVMRAGGALSARSLLAAADRRVAEAVERATPPEAMASAPIAPARGAMQLVPNWEVSKGGIRREAGAHWRAACALVAMNERARQRAEARGVAAVLPFSAGHIAIAEKYRGLVEWRTASGLKCASIEAGCGGSHGGSGLFIDTFIEQGERLAHLVAAIGTDAVMRPRRGMDRSNARRTIFAIDVVQQVVERGRDLSAVLRHFGWEANGRHRSALREGLCAALDRMQGYG